MLFYHVYFFLVLIMLLRFPFFFKLKLDFQPWSFYIATKTISPQRKIEMSWSICFVAVTKAPGWDHTHQADKTTGHTSVRSLVPRRRGQRSHECSHHRLWRGGTFWGFFPHMPGPGVCVCVFVLVFFLENISYLGKRKIIFKKGDMMFVPRRELGFSWLVFPVMFFVGFC